MEKHGSTLAGADDSNGRGAYNPAEAAAWLSISRTQLYRLVKRGELRARKCGSRVLVPRKALDEYLEAVDASDGRPEQAPAAKTASAVPDAQAV
jgi:excisionase family DNA binding protein